ncbi:MAG: Ig-like domain-containing protein [Arcicella sp.]|nr:Ig-like domain-containing protein [Arcicella sp.]
MRRVLAATLTCLMVLLLATPSIAQTATPKGKFDVRIKLKNNDCIAKKIVLLVQVKAHDGNSTFRLGDANFRFDYDPTVVINPRNISQENFSNAAPASDTNYGAQTLTGSQVSADGKMGIVSLNVLYSGSNAGAKLVGTDYITVACIQFDIVKGDGCVNFKWHNNNPATDFPITGMNEIIEVTADPYDYNNPVVASGDVFESYNVCLNTLCVIPTEAINDNLTTNINTAVTGNALTNDIPATGLTVKTTSLGTPLHGSISMSSTGAFTYTPSTGYVGKDSVQYEACNSTNICDKAYIVINVTGPAPVVNRDVYSTNINMAVTGNVLTNDTPNGGLTVKISPFPTPLHGSLTLSTNGAFTYTPTTGYVGKDSIQYEACNTNSQCVKAWAVFTITGSVNPNIEVDLALIKTVNQKKAKVGDLISYTITLTNQSGNTATSVSVKDFMPAGVLYKSYSTSTGTYDNATGIWTIGNVAPSQIINLMITVQAQAEGTFFNRAEIWTCDQVDSDSKPANTPLISNQTLAKGARVAASLPTNPILEDDNATTCFYVPIQICSGSGDEYDITVPDGYTGIQWYKDGTPINGATATTLRVSTIGSYTFTTLEGNCPVGGCCPAEFVSVDCCKPAVCVPYSVVKTKSIKK